MPEQQNPLWLLDIDGVINALARGPVAGSWPPNSWRQCVIRAVMPMTGFMVLPIFAAQPLLDFVAGVHASGRCEIRWHSTWRTAAVTELAPALDLPRTIPISIAPEWTQRPPGWWKLPAARRALASGRRLIWTDDDLVRYADEVADLSARDDALLISPDPHTGLTPDDVERINVFLDATPAP